MASGGSRAIYEAAGERGDIDLDKVLHCWPRGCGCYVRWKTQAEIYHSLLQNFIIEELGGVTNYYDMDDEELEYYYELSEEDGFRNTMPMFK